MDRSSAPMLSSILIRRTTPSALNQKNISTNALCCPTKQATRLSVGFHARTMMITLFLVDARVEFRTQMAFHAITYALWSSRTELRALTRQTSCQYGGILPIGASSILLILLYGLLLASNLFAMLQLLQKLTTWISSFVHLIQQGVKVEGRGKRSESRGRWKLQLTRRRRRRRWRKLGKSVTQLSLRTQWNIGP
jgi:hypothetical protein